MGSESPNKKKGRLLQRRTATGRASGSALIAATSMTGSFLEVGSLRSRHRDSSARSVQGRAVATPRRWATPLA